MRRTKEYLASKTSSRIGIFRIVAIAALIAIVVTANQFRDDVPLYGIAFFSVFLGIQLFVWPDIKKNVVVFNASFLLLAVSVAELALWYEESKPYEGYVTDLGPDYYTEDDDLGWSVTKGKRSINAVKQRLNEPALYEVVYSFDDMGLRETPSGGDKGLIFFFGGSFAFGEGVNDNETLPANVARLAEVSAINFALHGYGTHQFLRSLETGRPEKLGILEKPDLIVYIYIPDHMNRSAGRASWDDVGPKYNVGPGGLVYEGPFVKPVEKTTSRFEIRLTDALNRSQILRKVRERRQKNGTAEISAETVAVDFNRTLAMLEKASKLSNSRYDADMLVVVWDSRTSHDATGGPETTVKLIGELRKREIPVIVVSELNPAPDTSAYYIPNDGHPNAKAHAAIAPSIARFIGERLDLAE